MPRLTNTVLEGKAGIIDIWHDHVYYTASMYTESAINTLIREAGATPTGTEYVSGNMSVVWYEGALNVTSGSPYSPPAISAAILGHKIHDTAPLPGSVVRVSGTFQNTGDERRDFYIGISLGPSAKLAAEGQHPWYDVGYYADTKGDFDVLNIGAGSSSGFSRDFTVPDDSTLNGYWITVRSPSDTVLTEVLVENAYSISDATSIPPVDYDATPGEDSALITVESSPSNADIAINGVVTGHRTPHTFDLRVNDYTITLLLSGYVAVHYPISVYKDSPQTITHSFITGAPEEAGVTTFREESPLSDWAVGSRAVFERFDKQLEFIPVDVVAVASKAFYRVFWHKDPVTEEDITPDINDYIIVGTTIAAGAFAGWALVHAISSYLGAATVSTELANAGLLSQVSSGSPQTLGELNIVWGSALRTAPTAATGIWASLKAMPFSQKIFMVLGTTFLLTQLDATGWFFGLSPEAEHRKLETSIKQVRGSLIRLDSLTKQGMWDSAGELVGHLREQIVYMRQRLDAMPTSFWEHFGFSKDDVREMVDTIETELESYLIEFPAIESPIVQYPDELTGTVTDVHDGDTITLDNDYRIRFMGIDAHEVGTVAGNSELSYLNTLIFGKTVTVKIDPHKQIDEYGRILGVVFLGDKNISLEMLRNFGSSILTPTKYHNRHKYVDWDENKLVAESKEVPVEEPIAVPVAERVGSLKVGSSPTNARIFLDGVDTGLRTSETIDNLPAKTYDVTLQLESYETITFQATVEFGKSLEVYKKLVASPAAVKPAKPTRATLEAHFKAGIVSEAEATSGLQSLGYATDDINNYLLEWIGELKYSQIANIYKTGVATRERVTYYLEAQGYTAADVDGILKEWDAELEEEALSSTVGNLAVTSTPNYANVYLDGEYQNQVTPALIRSLAPGTYTVSCEAYEHNPKEEVVQVIAGEEVSVHLDLEPA